MNSFVEYVNTKHKGQKKLELLAKIADYHLDMQSPKEFPIFLAVAEVIACKSREGDKFNITIEDILSNQKIKPMFDKWFKAEAPKMVKETVEDYSKVLGDAGLVNDAMSGLFKLLDIYLKRKDTDSVTVTGDLIKKENVDSARFDNALANSMKDAGLAVSPVPPESPVPQQAVQSKSRAKSRKS